MVPRSLVLALLIVSVYGNFDVEGINEHLPLESTTIEIEGSASGDNGSGDGGIANDQFSINTDCSDREDGLYPIAACSPQFLTCSGGVDRIMDCPADLIYDSRIVACEYPVGVPGCGGFIAPEPLAEDVPESTTEEPETTTTEATTTTTEPSTTTEVLTSTVDQESINQRAAADRSCSEDGFFSYGECSDSYTACSSGRTIPMMCPSNLAFDQARQICDYPMSVPECGNQSGDDQEASGEETTTATDEEASGDDTSAAADVPLTTTESVYPEEITTEESQVYETVDEAATTPASDVPTCVEGATQIEACSQNYNNCVNGQEAVFTCENGLFFSQDKLTCVPAEELPECQQEETPY